MSIASGPKVVTDGLIFSLDMKNNKSWKGKPSTNYIPYPYANWNNSFILVYNNSNFGATYTYRIGVDNPVGAAGVMEYYTGTAGYKYFSIDSSAVSATDSYTFSYYARIVSGGTSSNLNNGQLWRANGTDRAVTGDWNPVFTTEWKRYSTTGPVEAGTILQYFPIHSGELTGGYTIQYCGFQLEQGTFASPFVYGSRSTTQAITDLTNNSPINIVAMTYNSDGTAYFNGPIVGNWLEATENYSIKPGNSFTYEIMCKHIANAGYDKILLGKQGWHLGLMDWGGTHGFQLRDGGPTWYSSTTTYSLNTWYHLVGVYVAGTGLSFYRNGSLIGTSNFATAVPDYGSTLCVGGSGNNNYSNGAYIDTAKVYNRALSATEIAYNFEAVRGRYGI